LIEARATRSETQSEARPAEPKVPIRKLASKIRVLAEAVKTASVKLPEDAVFK